MLTDPEEDYARGYVPFLGTTIFLDSKPLIPRMETEWWVEQAIKKITLYSNFFTEGKQKNLHVLDLFAGSGAIGIALLKHIPESYVTFGEIESGHLATIAKNIRENNISPERTTLIETDVWSALTGVFDIILTNPPYISAERHTAEVSTMHEPAGALYAKDDGFFYIEQTMRGLSVHLTENGICFIEHEPFHTERIHTLASLLALRVETFADQYEVLRFSELSHLNFFVETV